MAYVFFFIAASLFSIYCIAKLIDIIFFDL